jgi:hypothetical protein
MPPNFILLPLASCVYFLIIVLVHFICKIAANFILYFVMFEFLVWGIFFVISWYLHVYWEHFRHWSRRVFNRLS